MNDVTYNVTEQVRAFLDDEGFANLFTEEEIAQNAEKVTTYLYSFVRGIISELMYNEGESRLPEEV